MSKAFMRLFMFMLLILVGIVILDKFDEEYGPNPIYKDEVIEWAGYEPCCDQTWIEMCNNYKKEMNKTFNCFMDVE